MSWTRIRAIFVKELRDYRRNRADWPGQGVSLESQLWRRWT